METRRCFGAHRTEADARIDCPVDVLDEAEEVVLEDVAPLDGNEEWLLPALEDYVELLKELDV